MNVIKGLNTKTTLEHIIVLSNKNIVTVSKELQITPQQFSDWIKNRRPIPAERLLQLEKYFDIPANLLVDDRRFAKHLSILDSIELETLVVTNQIKFCNTDEKDELEYRINQLKEERQKQLRITRLSALLEKNDAQIMEKIDQFLTELEDA